MKDCGGCFSCECKEAELKRLRVENERLQTESQKHQADSWHFQKHLQDANKGAERNARVVNLASKKIYELREKLKKEEEALDFYANPANFWGTRNFRVMETAGERGACAIGNLARETLAEIRGEKK